MPTLNIIEKITTHIHSLYAYLQIKLPLSSQEKQDLCIKIIKHTIDYNKNKKNINSKQASYFLFLNAIKITNDYYHDHLKNSQMTSTAQNFPQELSFRASKLNYKDKELLSLKVSQGLDDRQIQKIQKIPSKYYPKRLTQVLENLQKTPPTSPTITLPKTINEIASKLLLSEEKPSFSLYKEIQNEFKLPSTWPKQVQIDKQQPSPNQQNKKFSNPNPQNTTYTLGSSQTGLANIQDLPTSPPLFPDTLEKKEEFSSPKQPDNSPTAFADINELLVDIVNQKPTKFINSPNHKEDPTQKILEPQEHKIPKSSLGQGFSKSVWAIIIILTVTLIGLLSYAMSKQTLREKFLPFLEASNTGWLNIKIEENTDIPPLEILFNQNLLTPPTQISNLNPGHYKLTILENKQTHQEILIEIRTQKETTLEIFSHPLQEQSTQYPNYSINYQPSNQAKTITPNLSIPLSQPQPNWQTLTTDELPFSILYPADWSYIQCDEENIHFTKSTTFENTFGCDAKTLNSILTLKHSYDQISPSDHLTKKPATAMITKQPAIIQNLSFDNLNEERIFFNFQDQYFQLTLYDKLHQETFYQVVSLITPIN